jgi:hypothetical protein
MNNNKNKTNSKKQFPRPQASNVVEALNDIGSGTVRSLQSDLLKETANDFMRELMGRRRMAQNRSGELKPGQELEMGKVLSGQQEKEEKEEKQKQHELYLTREESILVEKKGRELQVQLQALQQEVMALAQMTAEIDEEVEIAAAQAPVNPGVYHVVFFEKLIEFIKSFRKKIKNASVWLSASNKRAQKKDYWSRYKQHRGKFLLSPDHYLTRSAG